MQWPWSGKACKGVEDVPMGMAASVLDSHPQACSTLVARPMEIASRGAEMYSEDESSCLSYSPSDEGCHRDSGSDSLIGIFLEWFIKRTKSCISRRMQHRGLLSGSGKTVFPRFPKPDAEQHGDDDGEHWYRSHVRCADRVIDGRLIELSLETIEELPEMEEKH